MDPSPQPPVSPPAPSAASHEERTWAMFCHLAGLCGYVVPLGNALGPLVLWLIKREEFPLVNDQGKEALNFQLTMLIAGLICIPLVFACGIGIVLGGIVAVFDLVFIILATIKANAGVAYRYPVCIRFIR